MTAVCNLDKLHKDDKLKGEKNLSYAMGAIT